MIGPHDSLPQSVGFQKKVSSPSYLCCVGEEPKSLDWKVLGGDGGKLRKEGSGCDVGTSHAGIIQRLQLLLVRHQEKPNHKLHLERMVPGILLPIASGTWM